MKRYLEVGPFSTGHNMSGKKFAFLRDHWWWFGVYIFGRYFCLNIHPNRFKQIWQEKVFFKTYLY